MTLHHIVLPAPQSTRPTRTSLMPPPPALELPLPFFQPGRRLSPSAELIAHFSVLPLLLITVQTLFDKPIAVVNIGGKNKKH